MMASNFLNKLKWTNRLDNCEIVIRHRGAENDEKVIEGGTLTEVKRSYFSYMERGKEVTIPMHRILRIKVNDKVLWQRTRAGL